MYKLNAKQLQDVLFLAKQKCTGTKTELRQRLCSYLQITEITTSCESGSEEEDSEDAKMYCLTEDEMPDQRDAAEDDERGTSKIVNVIYE